MDKDVYYNYNKIMSYNAMLNFLVGERGVGKTYGAKKMVINNFIKKNEKFVYIRRYDNELKIGVSEFFKDISTNNEFKNLSFYSKNRKFYCNDQVFGYGYRLTQAQDLKGSTFTDVSTIIFDEFIVEKSRRSYLPNEVNIMLGVIESIARTRKIKVFFLGNSVSTTNPYYLYFNLTTPYNSDIKTFKNGLILVQHMQNKAYREAKKLTDFGKLVANTEYGNYAIENQFIDENNSFIEKKKASSKFQFAFIYQNSTFRRLV